MGSGYISTGDAATRLRTTARSVRAWVEQGKLRGEKIGNSVLVEEASVAALTPTLEQAMTTAQAAARLCTTSRTVRDWVDQGRLRGEKIGGRLLVSESSIAAFERLHGLDRSRP